MITNLVMHDERFLAKLLVTGAAYLVLLSIAISNTVNINAKELAMGITNTNTHTGSATKAELFFVDKTIEKEKWNNDINIRYPNSTILTLKDGIKHIRTTRYFNGRPVRLNIVEVNTKINDKLLFKPVMASNVLNKRETINNLAKKENALAAVNGSYFKPQTGVPLGTMMVDGKLLTGPIYNRVALGIKKNQFLMTRVELNAKLKSKHQELKIDNINQPRMLSTYVIVYDNNWGTISPATPQYGIQIAIKNGYITEISQNPIEIPYNGYVISGPKSKLEAFFNEKDIELELKTANKNWDNIDHIISGGPYLVKENEVFVDMTAEKLASIGGRNPRTAIGYTQDGKFIMVTADGREESSIGMTLMELAHFMKSLGCYNAMNLDGGGSSVMYFNGTTVNKPAVQGGIPLSNALVIYEENTQEKFAKADIIDG